MLQQAVMAPPTREARIHAALEKLSTYAFATLLHITGIGVLALVAVNVPAALAPAPSFTVELVGTKPGILPESTRDEGDRLGALLVPTAGHAEVPANAPFQEALGDRVGDLTDARAVLGTGIGGPSGFGRGGQIASRGGDSAGSQGALVTGLDWLVRHRSRDKAWGQLPADHAGSGDLPRRGEVAHTGLALLCFLAAGHGFDEGKYRDVMRDAREWLVERVSPRGAFPGVDWYHYYQQAIGTLALAEALARDPDDDVEQALRRAVSYLERTRNAGGWRYYGRHDGDTSVNGWVTLALRSAEHAGVKPSSESYECIRQWLAQVSSPDGTTGYTRMSDPTDAMNATGLFLRIMLGEAPTTLRNAAAARRVQPRTLVRDGDDNENLYELYYSALALYQVGGEPWREFNPRVRDALVRAQRHGTGCERGSWSGGGHLSGRVLGTCFATLTLETYYRYLPVHDGPEAANKPEAAPPPPAPSAGRQAMERASALVVAARARRDAATILSAEAAFEEALGALTDEQGDEAVELRLEARARLVELATLADDGPLLLRRIDEYLRGVPPGVTPSPDVLRLRRVEVVRRALDLVNASTVEGALPAARETAAAALDAAEARLNVDLADAGADLPARAEIDALRQHLRDGRAELLFAGDPDAALAAATREVEQGERTARVTPLERRVIGLRLTRAASCFQSIAAGEVLGAQVDVALKRGDDDLAWVTGRDPDERLLDRDRVSLDPLLERVSASRLAALVVAGRPEDALAGVTRFMDDFPGSSCAAQVAAIERAALSARVASGHATPDERARFADALTAWSASSPPLAPEDALALGLALLDASAPDPRSPARAEARGKARAEARRQLAAAPGDGERGATARAALSRLCREDGDLEGAEAALAGLPPAAEQRLGVVLERALLDRARGRPDAALTRYTDALRGLPNRSPSWWQVAEAMAATYLEAREFARARQFLEQLRRLDPGFGGDEARRDRFVEVMRRADAER